MVARLSLLILVLVATPGLSGAAATGCRGCHPVHYAQVGSCVSCHRGDDRTGRKRIAHYRLIPARYAAFTLPDSEVVARGGKLLEDFGCRRCHTAGNRGTTLAASLDRAGAKAPEQLAAAIDTPAYAMPAFRFAPRERDDLVNYILRQGRERGDARGETPMVVHFSRTGQGGEHPFVTRCGGCHKALTVARGGVGTGDAGPNLSGLFTSFYPRPFREHEPWTPARLKEWLKNPRTIRSLALMPPVPLAPGELERITELLEVSRGVR